MREFIQIKMGFERVIMSFFIISDAASGCTNAASACGKNKSDIYIQSKNDNKQIRNKKHLQKGR